MTRNQLNVAIEALLDRTHAALKNCENVGSDSASVWTANMAASMVLGALVDALIKVRDVTPRDPIEQPPLKLFNPDDSTVES